MKDLLGGKLTSELIRLLINNTPVAYIILDDQYRIHYINDSFLKLRKLDPLTTIGEKCYNISNGGVQCKQCAVDQALKSGQKAFIARKDTLPDGSVRFIDDYAIPLYKNEEDGTQYILEIMVNRTQDMLIREKRNDDYAEMLSIFSSLLEAKDAYTATHSECVRKLALKLANALKLPTQDIFDISIAASLHDLGKIHIPDTIINKPGKLSDDEFYTIKSHPTLSFEMLEGLTSFNNIKNIVKQHHERFDGRGYPDGLGGNCISTGAKIVAVADTYDAITSTRSYRKALSHEYALDEIRRVAGTQLDPAIVNTFVSMNFTDNTDTICPLDKDHLQVERILAKKQVQSDTSKVQEKDFKKYINMDRLLHEIFENTPCGYVIMDIKRQVLFASKYFLSYMGLTESDVLGKVCYEVATTGSPCPNCAIERAVATGNVEYMRQEQLTNCGLKIFDLFGMPLKNSDGTIEYVIEIIIDRTEEALFERQREEDFRKLIEMLGRLLDKQTEIPAENLSYKIVNLKERLHELQQNLTLNAAD